MSEHHASVVWTRTSADFAYDSYNRAHEMRFKNGAIALASSSAPAFKGDADRVDPEEAFVASLSSCHMLTFLAICARKRLTVDSYEDRAVGFLEKGEGGKLWMTRVVLRPSVRFGAGTEMNEKILADLHHKSHEECFIANSVKTNVSIEPHS
ncbi:MAG TPA: OsmC family protein [Rhizomicrobium sp.]|jgi:organic hydroperoxide reductase OsmC/OhrA|nr:OsmC family protein [Rhizomicrobium sp.]HVZ90667.1 OsmC family protein [Rhizomicrobium sp.]